MLMRYCASIHAATDDLCKSKYLFREIKIKNLFREIKIKDPKHPLPGLEKNSDFSKQSKNEIFLFKPDFLNLNQIFFLFV